MSAKPLRRITPIMSACLEAGGLLAHWNLELIAVRAASAEPSLRYAIADRNGRELVRLQGPAEVRGWLVHEGYIEPFDDDEAEEAWGRAANAYADYAYRVDRERRQVATRNEAARRESEPRLNESGFNTHLGASHE